MLLKMKTKTMQMRMKARLTWTENMIMTEIESFENMPTQSQSQLTSFLAEFLERTWENLQQIEFKRVQNKKMKMFQYSDKSLKYTLEKYTLEIEV